MADALTPEQANTIAYARGARMRLDGAPRPDVGHKAKGWDEVDRRLAEFDGRLKAVTDDLDRLRGRIADFIARIEAVEQRPDAAGGYAP